MSDEFIPFNQSTPKTGGWQRKNSNNSRYYNQNGSRQQFNNRWSNKSQRNSSNGGDSFNNSRQNSYSYAYDVNAYLHPAMLQDPWEQLRKNQAQ